MNGKSILQIVLDRPRTEKDSNRVRVKRTSVSSLLGLAVLAVLTVQATAAPDSKGTPPRIDAQQLPVEMQENYKAFRAKCGACHTPERVFRARYETAEAWRAVVPRMAKLRGANLNAQDQKRVEEFLTYYTQQLSSSRPVVQATSASPDATATPAAEKS